MKIEDNSPTSVKKENKIYDNLLVSEDQTIDNIKEH